MDFRDKLKIGIIGGHSPSRACRQKAYLAGCAVARKGAVLICGGLGGVMEEAARGAKSQGGMTIGILPGACRQDANAYIDIPIVTGMGHARNVILVQSCDGIISLSGSFGTLTETAMSLLLSVPIVGIGAWKIRRPDMEEIKIPDFEDPEKAAAFLFSEISQKT